VSERSTDRDATLGIPSVAAPVPDAPDPRRTWAERVLETSAEAFVGMDGSGTITEWNRAAERMFGIGRADAIGLALADVIIAPRYREEHRHGLAHVLGTAERRGPDKRLEITGWHADGREFPVELAIWATREGDHWILYAFLRDITEQRRIDTERERLLTEQRLLLESALHGIYRLDRDGRCVFVNPAATRLLGWTAEQLVGNHIDVLIHHHPPGTGCPVEVVTRTGKPVRVDEDVLWCADGTSIPVEYSCSPVVTDGEIDGVVVTFADVSERRRAELSLRTAYDHERLALAKLTELDEAKTNFLATVSHELRTPLTSLTGYLELFTDGDVGPVSDQQRRILSTVSRNADRLRALIEDLLTVSSVEARPLRLTPVYVGIADVVGQAVALVEDAALHRGHRLTIDVEPGSGAVRVDPTQFRRVLASLLDNAIKCTPPGGHVDVIARRTGPGVVEIAVRDDGIGIDAAELPRLFTRFFRTRAATQLAIQGAGLSLAIARQIIDGHGGSIDVDTAPGVGSTFTISLAA
jgi:PAS domain S-box-containing protein